MLKIFKSYFRKNNVKLMKLEKNNSNSIITSRKNHPLISVKLLYLENNIKLIFLDEEFSNYSETKTIIIDYEKEILEFFLKIFKISNEYLYNSMIVQTNSEYLVKCATNYGEAILTNKYFPNLIVKKTLIPNKTLILKTYNIFQNNDNIILELI